MSRRRVTPAGERVPGRGSLSQPADERDVSAPVEDDSEDAKAVSGAAGALVAVANSKPVTALLGPAFGALGDYWGERMQETVEGWRKKRAANLQEHVERVLEVEGPPSHAVPTEEQARLAASWEQVAQTIDPQTDAHLSGLWEGLLGRIYAKDADAAALQEALGQLGPSEAKVLLEFRNDSRPSAELAEIMEKLEALRLVRGFNILRHYRDRPTQVLMPLLAIVAGFTFSSYAQVMPSLGELPSTSYVLMAMGPTLGLAGALAAIYPMISRVGRYQLTSLGKKLRSIGLRYASSRDIKQATSTSARERRRARPHPEKSRS